jgi:hypothetical protein
MVELAIQAGGPGKAHRRHARPAGRALPLDGHPPAHAGSEAA